MTKKGKYKLGRRSLKELEGVHPDMVRVVKRAIEITEQDFAVHDGLRSIAQQRKLVAAKKSRTMNSKHLRQKDKHGHATDLVPYIDGKLKWEWGAIYHITRAVRQAAKELDVQIRWGGCWQVITSTSLSPQELVKQYRAKRIRQGRKPFADGPHFEIKVKIYLRQ